jgi:hypothetical protein
MLGPLLFLLVTTFEPPHPTVGDPITIQFAVPTVVGRSADYEIVSRQSKSVVIRSFVPHTIAVTGRSADGPVSVMIPIHSVLKPDDKLEPAPLKPPKAEPWPGAPFIAIGIAAFAAIAIWAAVIFLARRRLPVQQIVVVPADAFRAKVAGLRDDTRAAMRWAQLAGAVRSYLAAVRPDLGVELTTSEVLPRLGSQTNVEHILRQGDLEKFSPWGAEAADFDEVAAAALEIPSWAGPVAQADVAA